MEHEIDLAMADRDVLIGIIVRQQAIIERLEKRIAQLEGQAKAKGSGRMPGLKPKTDRKPGKPKQLGNQATTQATSPRLCPHPDDAYPAS